MSARDRREGTDEGFAALLGVGKPAKVVSFEKKEKSGREEREKEGRQEIGRLKGKVEGLEMEIQRWKRKTEELWEGMKRSEERWWSANKDLERQVRDLKEKVQEMVIERETAAVKDGKVGSASSSSAGESSADAGSRAGATTGGAGSTWSVCTASSRRGDEGSLNGREIEKVKEWVRREEVEKSRKNIAIRGLRLRNGGEEGKKELQDRIWRMIGVACKVNGWKRSGEVFIAELGSEEEKWEVLRSKSRLKGREIYIGMDQTFEERRRQDEIRRWAWKMRKEGKEVKIGNGRVKVEGKWWNWELIKTREKMREEREKEREREENEKEEIEERMREMVEGLTARIGMDIRRSEEDEEERRRKKGDNREKEMVE